MTAVMIGADPHKGSRTAVAISAAEVPLGTVRVRASAGQAGKLVEWAADWPERTWAVEGAGGLGHLLAQQLVAAGEKVIDVQPKLGARVRLLPAGTPDTVARICRRALPVEGLMRRSIAARNPGMLAHAAWREPQQLECGVARWQSDGSAGGWFAGPGPASGTARPPPSARPAITCLGHGPFSVRPGRAGEYSRGGAVRPRSAGRTVTDDSDREARCSRGRDISRRLGRPGRCRALDLER